MKPLTVLAWDTATPWCALALARFDDQGMTVLSDFLEAEGPHSQTLPPRVAQTLRSAGLTPADVDLVAVGRGPGSFTGLRTGLALAKGLAMGARIPIVGISTLDILAELILEEAGADTLAAPLIDARHGEIFTALYRPGPAGPEAVKPPRPLSPADIPGRLTAGAAGRKIIAAGPALNLMRAAWPAAGLTAGPEDLAPGASRLARLAVARYRAGPEAMASHPPLPMYFRQPDIRQTGLALR
jgi:tRNA threonylcarbamoyladenosine biosynthesis protein TsaB